MLTVKVDPGTHTIELRKDGYFPIKFSVTVEAGKTYNISKTLIPTNAITITSISISPTEPKVGDTVQANITVRNNANTSVKGRVVVSFNGQTKTSSEFTLAAGSQNTVSISLGSFDSAKSVTLDIKAQVYVEEHSSGAGWYVTDEKTYTFTVAERKATITITTTPAGVDVYIDGRYVGKT